MSSEARNDSLSWLVPSAFVAMVAGLWAALIYAPTVRIEGDIQRIFYIHVPAAFTMYLVYFALALASVMYLVQRRERWDEVAVTAADLSLLFGTIVLTTGPVWGRIAWGAWWTWDGRLTSTLVLWLILVAYQMLRHYGGDGEQAARYCAVLAIIGLVDIPIIHYSVQWWRTMHPEPKVMTEGSIGGGLGDPAMLVAWAIGMVATLGLATVLFAYRLRLERQQRRVERAVELLHESTAPVT